MDISKWIVFYPAYIDSKKSIADGRRIPMELCVEEPHCREILEVCHSLGLVVAHEVGSSVVACG